MTSKVTFYELKIPVEKSYRMLSEEQPIYAVPSSDDIPVGMNVQPDGQVIRLDFVYPRPVDEPRRSTKYEFLELEIGRRSSRLFTVKIDMAALARAATATEGSAPANVASRLQSALSRLVQSEPRLGAKLNYKLAAQGLELQDSDHVPPAWLINAMAGQGAGSHRDM